MLKTLPGKGKLMVALISACLLMTSGGIMAWQLKPSGKTEANNMPESGMRLVKSVVIKETEQIEKRSFPALIHVDREVKLAFRVGGILEDFHVGIGQKMGKGDIIAKLDPRDYKLNIVRLKAAIEEAEAGLKAMQTGARMEDISMLESDLNASRAVFNKEVKNLERNEKLIQKKLITKHAYDQSYVAYESARARVNIALQSLNKATKGARIEEVDAAKARIKRLKADLSAAEFALSDTTLKAPFTGFINMKYLENYETVSPGQSIVSLLDFSHVEARTSIPEEMMIKRAGFDTIYCTLESYPGMRFPAEIKELGKKTSNANQSYPLTASLALPENFEVQPGMAATLHISYHKPDQKKPGYLIPVNSVFSDADGNSCVWLINPGTHRISKKNVKTGYLQGDTILILDGLHSGDQVVTTGVKFLYNEQMVRIIDDNGDVRS